MNNNQILQLPKQKPSPSKPWLLTGPSGSGKDYLSEQISLHFGVLPASLDSLGTHEEINGKPRWYIDPEYVKRILALKKYSVYSLICDNLDDILPLFKTVVVVKVDTATLQRVTKMKMADYDANVKAGHIPKGRKASDIWKIPHHAELVYSQMIVDFIGDWWKEPNSDRGLYIVDNNRKAESSTAWHKAQTPAAADAKFTLRKEAGYVKKTPKW